MSIYAGDVCRKGKGSEPDYVCSSEDICDSLAERAESVDHFDVCSFNGTRPIICCPSPAIVKRSKRQVSTDLAARSSFKAKNLHIVLSKGKGRVKTDY